MFKERPFSKDNNFAIAFRNQKNGFLSWEELNNSAEAQNIITERAKQGLIAIATGSKREILQVLGTEETERDKQSFRIRR